LNVVVLAVRVKVVDTLALVLVWLVGGSAAVGLIAIYIRNNVRLHHDRSAMASAYQPVFIGGVRFHATGGLNSGMRWNFTRPYAWLALHDDRIVISLRDEARLLARQMTPPVPVATTLRFDEIAWFDPNDFRGGIRFRTSDSEDNRDGLVFWGRGRDRASICDRLTSAGVPAAPPGGRQRSTARRFARPIFSRRHELTVLLPLLAAVALIAWSFGWQVAAYVGWLPVLFWLMVIVADRRGY
jgi:hypothetical protein